MNGFGWGSTVPPQLLTTYMGMALSAAGQGGMTAWAAHPPVIGEIHGPMRRGPTLVYYASIHFKRGVGKLVCDG